MKILPLIKHLLPHEVESGPDQSPADVKDNSKTQRSKHLQYRDINHALSDDDPETDKTEADKPNEVGDHEPGKEEVGLALEYSKESQNVAGQEKREANTFSNTFNNGKQYRVRQDVVH